jgi:ribosomal protein S18 acetylase RimI-like enzyme
VADLTSLQHPDRHARPSWRLAAGRDSARIIEMNERLNLEDPSQSTSFDRAMMQRTLTEIATNPIRGAVAVLASGHHLCGYALLISFWSNEFGGEVCVIDELYVEPEFRGRGFATEIVQSLAHGASPIWPRRMVRLSVEAYRSNPRAKALYERLGFAVSRNHVLTLALPSSAAQ